jgi:hypothetical protein
MWRRVALVDINVSEERIVSNVRMKRARWLGTTLAAFLHNVVQLLFIANVVPSSLILSTLKMEELLSSETSVLTRATRRRRWTRNVPRVWYELGSYIPEDGILRSHRSEKL